MGSSPPLLAVALTPLPCSWLCLCSPSLAALFVSPDCADFRLEPDPLSSFVVSWSVVGCCAPPAWEDSGGWWPTVGDSATMLHNTMYVRSCYTRRIGKINVNVGIQWNLKNTTLILPHPHIHVHVNTIF